MLEASQQLQRAHALAKDVSNACPEGCDAEHKCGELNCSLFLEGWAEIDAGACLAPAWYQASRKCPRKISLGPALALVNALAITCAIRLSFAQAAYLQLKSSVCAQGVLMIGQLRVTTVLRRLCGELWPPLALCKGRLRDNCQSW